MKRSIHVLTLAGALLICASALPAVAQSQADIANDPQSISYSWGVLHSPADGPQVAYTRSELNQTPRTAAQSTGVEAGFQPGPADIAYSWGVIHSPADGPPVAIPNGNRVVAQAPAQSKGVEAEFTADFDHITYSWGVIHSPVDGPQVTILNGKRISASAGAAADIRNENPQEAYRRTRPDPRD